MSDFGVAILADDFVVLPLGEEIGDQRFDSSDLGRFSAIGRLTAIKGIDHRTALVLVGELGPDLSRFPTVKKFTAWLGLSLQHQISGGKVQSRRGRPGMNHAAHALRLTARSLHHSKSALGAFYRQMRSRLGAPQAIVATAYKLSRLVDALLTKGEAYVGQATEEYEPTYQARKLLGLCRQAQSLGYLLEPLPLPTTAP